MANKKLIEIIGEIQKANSTSPLVSAYLDFWVNYDSEYIDTPTLEAKYATAESAFSSHPHLLEAFRAEVSERAARMSRIQGGLS